MKKKRSNKEIYDLYNDLHDVIQDELDTNVRQGTVSAIQARVITVLQDYCPELIPVEE